MFIKNREQAFYSEEQELRSIEPRWLNTLRRKIVGRISNLHRPGTKPDIFMFSSPRSGSTFIMELMDNEPGMKTFDEPLNVNDYVKRKELGAGSWEEATILQNREDKYKRYFSRLIRNELTALNPPLFRKNFRLTTIRNFFKIIHGGEDILSWFEKEFNASILILIRHPISVSLSHWVLPRLPYLLEPSCNLFRRLTKHQMSFAKELFKTSDVFELSILDWCLQNYFLTRKELPDTWTRISYEEVVLYPKLALDYLFDRLMLDGVVDAESLIRRPSKTVVGRASNVRAAIKTHDPASRKILVERWKDKGTSKNSPFWASSI